MKLTKSQLKKIIKEELKLSEAEAEMITLPGATTGGGRVRVDQLEQRIKEKLEDLLKRATTQEYYTISKEQLIILANEWEALSTAMPRDELGKL
jgi:O-acetyl-ADP-ribose deacetylase (regulator of RNase III)